MFKFLNNLKRPLTTAAGVLNLVATGLSQGVPTNKSGFASWAVGLIVSGILMAAKDPGDKN